MNPIFSSNPLLDDVHQLIAARQRVASTVNAELLRGQRAEYGKQVIAELAKQLTTEFGKGWSERQLHYCLRVAEAFPDAKILHTLCSELSWSHLRLNIQTAPPDVGQAGQLAP